MAARLRTTRPGYRRRGRDPEPTREKLLRAGTELFAVHGFDGVSVEALAAAAGVNRALVSYHFGGKRRLYREILRTTLAAALERMQALVAESDRRPDDLLRDFVKVFHRWATVERPYFPALLLRELLSAGEAFDEDVVPAVFALFQVVRGILERGMREGVFRHVDPFLTHLGMIGSLAFFYATEPTRRRAAAERRLPMAAPRPEQFLRHMQEMVVRGLAVEPASRVGRGAGPRVSGGRG